MKITRVLRVFMPVALVAGWAFAARAEVTRVEIKSRADVLNGKAWGAVGPYERVVGTVHFTVDPKKPRNTNINNIGKAPRNAQGLVEFSSDIYILAPKNPAKGNGVAFFEVPNRGNRGLMSRYNRAAAFRNILPPGEADFGDGYLLRNGYTLVWVGWQFSLARNGSLIGIDLPVASENGQPVAGRVNAPFIINAPGPTLALDPDTSRYPPVDLNSPDARLTVRQNIYDVPRVIPRDQWQFAKLVNGAVVPDAASLYMKDGFQGGLTYELSYTAKNTPIGALGYSALRDVASTFKYQKGAVVSAKYAYAMGSSQTGRFVREFLYEGFNADEQGRKVFDAMWAHIAGAARGDFAQPFSLPNGLGIFTASMFPFSDAPQWDPATGRNDGLLMRMSRNVLPKVVYTNGDCEYWGGGRAGALMHTSLDGKRDLKLPENVRIYTFASTQHGPAAFPPSTRESQQMANPNENIWAMRAILAGLDGWVRKGVEPPASRYPNLGDGTLIPQSEVKFPSIPDVQSPLLIPGGYRADVAGPLSAPRLPFLVSKVDADGNDVGGLRMPDVVVPLATYTGWNFRKPESGAPREIVPLTGSFIPFPATRAEREQKRDPRLSVEERYTTREDYLGKVKAAAEKLVQERYVLSEDVEPIVTHAGKVWDYVTGATLNTQK